VKRKAALLAGALAGAVAAVFLRGRRPAREASPGGAADPRAAELREKLAQAREGAADEDDFEAAGMGAETIVHDEAPEPDPDVDAARRRVHEQGRAAADEMRRSAEPGAEDE
jgi:hypothetical protein